MTEALPERLDTWCVHCRHSQPHSRPGGTRAGAKVRTKTAFEADAVSITELPLSFPWRSGPPGLVKASLEDGGASHREASADSSCSGNFVKRVAVPFSWLEELGAEVGSFVPHGSSSLLACLPRHRQVSSYRGVPFENKQGR